MGTLEPRKDVGTLIAAFDIVADRDADVALVIAGGKGWGDPGSTPRWLRRATPTASGCLGYATIDTVPALLRGAAAVAYPSRDEGFGLPVLEAMACGAPVVTTQGTAMAEVAGDGAVLVPGGDVGALAEAIESMLAGGADGRGICGAVASARAAQFTWAASAEGHVAAYRSVG